MAAEPPEPAGIGEPYLSVVATARNDDHGGNLLGRMQIFVNGWIAQCVRHHLPSELIVVEWNPPADRPRLCEALQWPEELGPCQVRFVEVPEELHRRFRHADALPLFQMIAKNVGIRRARGQFVLATNIDILFSDELVRYLAARRLRKGRMYRMDRHDVEAAVPAGASMDEQLAWCRSHVLRVCTREGTFSLTPEGRRALGQDDIAPYDSGVSFGPGWFPVERYSPEEEFRWVENDAEVVIRAAPGTASRLRFELEPGPGVGGGPFLLQVLDRHGFVAAESSITGRTQLVLTVPASNTGDQSFRFHLTEGGLPVVNDPRIRNFRVFRCEVERAGQELRTRDVRPEAHQGSDRLSLDLEAGPSMNLEAGEVCIRNSQGEVLTRVVGDSLRSARVALHCEPGEELAVSVVFRATAPPGSGSGWVGDAWLTSHRAEPRQPQAWPLEVLSCRTGTDWARHCEPSRQAVGEMGKPICLHIYACGDFTLMAREHWFSLRGYPEFEIFSMHLDSVLCYAAHHAGLSEEILQDPLRIYHIEHSTGSGWTPEGDRHLFSRLASRGIPCLSYPELVEWIDQMRRLHSPIVFNRSGWGLQGEHLKETVIQQGRPG